MPIAGTQPIVIIGGIFSFPIAYEGMRDTLSRITGQPVSIVRVLGYDWIPSPWPPRWARLLRQVERAVHQAIEHSTTGKITLIGHSAGGVLSRLYLSPQAFLGHVYRGLDYVDHLITLGSPHIYAQKSWSRGWLPRWVEKRYPGAYLKQVRYTSIAGRLIRGDWHGSARERFAYALYREIAGYGTAWGDGLVPMASALLQGAQQIVLEGVGHYAGFGGPWYGADEIIPVWWDAAF